MSIIDIVLLCLQLLSFSAQRHADFLSRPLAHTEVSVCVSDAVSRLPQACGRPDSRLWCFPLSPAVQKFIAKSPGTGWTGTFLVPLLQEKKISYAATTQDGRDGTIEFRFDPESIDPQPFHALPQARCVVIVFPIKTKGGSTRLVRNYRSVYPDAKETRFIQLGSIGIWDVPRLPCTAMIIVSLKFTLIAGRTYRYRREAEASRVH